MEKREKVPQVQRAAGVNGLSLFLSSSIGMTTLLEDGLPATLATSAVLTL